MRICPRCGHVDPIWWRPNGWNAELSYADAGSIMMLEPDLWNALQGVKRGQLIRRGPFLYWKSSRSNTIRRAWTEDYSRVGKHGNPQEKTRLYEQTKLDRLP